MTESIDYNDRYLDPPNIPEYGICERCGEREHLDDMVEGVCHNCSEELILQARLDEVSA